MSRRILVSYFYKGKGRSFNIIECDEQISTVCEVNDDMSVTVVSPGMSLEEIIENFPADINSKRAGYDFCMLDLIRAIIWEAYRDGTGEPGNVRHFWYTHIKYIVEDILKMGETESVKGAINKAWENLVVSGRVTYEEMGIESAKEDIRKSYIRDSPFSNLLIAVEKENLFNEMKWIPELFNCTLITAAGQPSRAVSRNYARELVGEMEERGTDLDETLYMCSISDLDPAGYFIQEAFKDQIQKAIQYYGGSGEVEIVRLFVTKKQVTPELLQHKAMKCEDVGATSPRAKKAEDTKWEHFCKMTDGGLYKEENGKRYRAKMELDAFPIPIIERQVVMALLEIIEETSDESLIMIPEIMRIFGQLRKEVIEEIVQHHKAEWLQPIIDEFLSQTLILKEWFVEKTREELEEEEERFEEETEEITDRYQDERDESEATAEAIKEEQQEVINDYEFDTYPGEFGYDTRRDEIKAEIAELEMERNEINNEIRLSCSENYEEIDRAWHEHEYTLEDINDRETEEMAPFVEVHDANNADIGLRAEYRQTQLEEFKNWKAADFNPIEQELRENVESALDIDKMEWRYRDLEGEEKTQEHVANLMRQPEALLDEETSAWEQEDYPVFEETGLLEKAASSKRKNIEPFRRGFVPEFKDSMKDIVHEVGDEVTIEYPERPEIPDISEDMEKLKEEVEKAIEDGEYKESEEDEESDE